MDTDKGWAVSSNINVSVNRCRKMSVLATYPSEAYLRKDWRVNLIKHPYRGFYLGVRNESNMASL